MSTYLKQSNLPVLLLSALFVKGLFFQPGSFEIVSVFIVVVLFGYKLYLDHIKKPDFSQEVINKFEELEQKFNSKLEEVNEENELRTKHYEAKISAISIGMNKKDEKSTNFGWG